jgi:hypothetical protein
MMAAATLDLSKLREVMNFSSAVATPRGLFQLAVNRMHYRQTRKTEINALRSAGQRHNTRHEPALITILLDLDLKLSFK